MNEKLKKYADMKFAAYPKTKEITELKEELLAIMCDKYDDCIKHGADEKTSLEKAKRTLDGYKQAIREVDDGTTHDGFVHFMAGFEYMTGMYFAVLALVFLFVSLVIFKSFEKSWLIMVGGSFVYLFVASCMLSHGARLFDKRLFFRIAFGGIYLSFIPILYVFPNLLISVFSGKNQWRTSWLVALIIFVFWALSDLYVFSKESHKLYKVLEKSVCAAVFVTVIYLSLGYFFGLWSVAWMIYILLAIGIGTAFYVDYRRKKR